MLTIIVCSFSLLMIEIREKLKSQQRTDASGKFIQTWTRPNSSNRCL